jgi:hypothetical protein
MYVLSEAERVIERFRNLFESPTVREEIGYNVIEAALEYVNHNECGVALELVSTQLLDNRLAISKDDFIALEQFATTYQFMKDVNLEELKQLIS